MADTLGDRAAPARGPELSAVRHFSTLFDYLFCVLASSALVELPVPGGALFMLFAVTGTAVGVFRAPAFRELPRILRVSGRLLAVFGALISLALLLAYPLPDGLPRLWVVFGLVLLVSLRSIAAKGISAYCASRGLTKAQASLRLAELALIFLAIAAALLFPTLHGDTAWYLLGGFALSTLYEAYALSAAPEAKARPPRRQAGPPALKALKALAGVNAYRVFALVSAITVTALQVTMVLVFSFIAASAGELFKSMGIALGFAFLALQATRWLLPRGGDRDPANVLLLGLAVWLFGLIAFGLRLTRPDSLWPYASLAACTAGGAVTFAALRALEKQMPDILAFATGEDPGQTLQTFQGTLLEYAALAGRVIALAGLALVLLHAGTQGADALRLQPALLVPAGILVCAALLAAFRFPLEKRYADKLRSFLLLKENGETNAPLQKQLENAIVRVRKRRYGIKLLMLALRPFFPSRVVGEGTVRLEEGVSAIFACNHGELYGPIVAYLYIPFRFRPWSINEMVDQRMIADYIYTYTFQQLAWVPARLRRPLADFCAPMLTWIMRSIESIPVHRDNPRALIETFRETCAAMEAGDNILLFPENPNDASLEKPGYLQEGVGPFSTGFVMAAQMYHQKTGRRAQFVPVFADKATKTLSFGETTRYDPDRPPNDEKQRVVSHLRSEMLRLAGAREKQ